jgi:predicted lactoylglutathione lyase
MQFYLALGFQLNPLFTDAQQKCLMWSDAIYLMIQTIDFSNEYFKKLEADPRQIQTTSHTLPVESELIVNGIIEKGLQAGGSEPRPLLNESFMYLRTIEDPDGYLWGMLYLNIDKFKNEKQKV